VSGPSPVPRDDADEPPLDVEDMFALGESPGHMMRHTARPNPGDAKSSALMIAIILHVVAALIVGFVLYWKFYQPPAP
jgi:hypothetical protein